MMLQFKMNSIEIVPLMLTLELNRRVVSSKLWGPLILTIQLQFYVILDPSSSRNSYVVYPNHNHYYML